MKTTYNGITKEFSNNLLDPVKVTKNKPKKSNKFGALSLYYDGIHYFPNDIKINDSKNFDKPYKIEAVYYSGKWYQDTFYITEEFKNFLIKHI
jgi:hypothetical protein